MLQAPKRRLRCALTGVPVQPGDAVMIVGLDAAHPVVERVRYLRTRQTRVEPTGDVISAPVTLHRHTTEGVGLEYAVMMAKYLSAALDAKQQREHLAMLAWWNDEYGVRRVYNGLYGHLEQRYASERAAEEAQHILLVVVTCHREQASPAVMAERFGETPEWVYRKVDWCMKLAHHHRATCHCEQCQQRRQQRGA